MNDILVRQEINEIINSIEGEVGIYACHPETGYEFKHQENQLFPMASTYKIPIAMHCLRQVELGMMQLDDFINIHPCDVRFFGNNNWLSNLELPGVQLSLANLLQLMLTVSDNTATDIILHRIGGPNAVTDYLRSLGIQDMTVNRSTLRMLADHTGIEHLPAEERCSLVQFSQLANAIPDTIKEQAATRFYLDLRDTTTPYAMGELLMKMQQPAILHHDHLAFLLQCMRNCKTGLNRIRAKIPAEVQVADKTGTISGVTNDVGIISLPNDNGNLILAIYITKSITPLKQREQAIADIAEILFKHVYLNKPKSVTRKYQNEPSKTSEAG
ncbi:MAG: class A beta-lactamase [Coxiellaceae bacterium]|nr:MAG: class A beta-lactamase [Coxiellaceae bacterium]